MKNSRMLRLSRDRKSGRQRLPYVLAMMTLVICFLSGWGLIAQEEVSAATPCMDGDAVRVVQVDSLSEGKYYITSTSLNGQYPANGYALSNQVQASNPYGTQLTRTEAGLVLGGNVSACLITVSAREGEEGKYNLRNSDGKYLVRKEVDGSKRVAAADSPEEGWWIAEVGESYGKPQVALAYGTERDTLYIRASGSREREISFMSGEWALIYKAALFREKPHTLTKTEAKEASCTEAGNSEYWSCSECGKFFSDEAGDTEIEENSWVIAAKGHEMTKTEAKEPDCTEDGNIEYWTCSRCEKSFADEEGNTEVDPSKSADQGGVIIYSEGHDLTVTEAKEAGCTEDGNVEYWTCSRCEKYFADNDGVQEFQEGEWVIKAPGHQWGPWKKVSEAQHERICQRNTSHIQQGDHKWDAGRITKKAACTEKGEKTFICSLCKGIKTEEIPAAGHKYGGWKKLNDKQHRKVCANDKSHVIKENHKWGPAKITRKATQNQTGIKTWICNTCGGKKTAVIPKTADAIVAQAIAKGSTSAVISWNRIAGADRYVIYMTKCDGHNTIAKKAGTVSGSKLKWTKKGLAKNTSYKFKVVAQKKSGGGYTVMRNSRPGHFVTGNEKGPWTNPKSLSLNRSKVTLKKGKTVTIRGSVTKARSGKRLLTSHTRLLRYMSNDPKVAAVNENGKVTAKGAGVCRIYVQTINGMWKVCQVTVK